MNYFFFVISAFILLFYKGISTENKCQCEQYSYYECNHLNPPSCTWDYNKKKCDITRCRNLDKILCSSLNYCYWAGDFVQCYDRPESCEQYIFEKYNPLDCKLVGCGMNQNFSKCQSKHNCSQYNPSDCPISCYNSQTSCLENICENYIKSEECEKCPNYKFILTSQKCMKFSCGEIVDQQNCNQFQQEDGIYCYWQDEKCIEISLLTECNKFNNENLCLLQQKCIFSDNKCVDKICGNYKSSQCQEPFIQLIKGKEEICVLKDWQCQDGSWADFKESTCFKQGNNYHWVNNKCKMCNDTDQDEVITFYPPLIKCACDNFSYLECKQNEKQNKGCYWYQNHCYQMDCEQITERVKCEKLDFCYWGGTNTKCKQKKSHCSDYQLDDYNNCQQFHDANLNLCISNYTSCIEQMSCVYYQYTQCPKSCYQANQQCVSYECKNFISEQECLRDWCAGKFYWSYDDKCKPIQCHNLTENCSGQKISNGNVCQFDESSKTCVELKIDSDCELFNNRKACEKGIKNCIFIGDKCRNKKCEDMNSLYCLDPTLYLIEGEWKVCSKNESRCKENSAKDFVEQNCSNYYNFSHFWAKDQCLKCEKMSVAVNITDYNRASILFKLIEILLLQLF